LSAIAMADLVVPERVVAGLRGADKSQLLKELAGAEHVRALSSIARRLRDAAVVKRIRQAAGTGEIYLALTA
jgi:hypothetical protein